MWPLSLRARLVGAFVGVVVVGTFLAAIATMLIVHRTFDSYLERRADEAVRNGVVSAQESYARGGNRWTEPGLDRLAHELVLTGYDFRLTGDGVALIDTTRSASKERALVRVAQVPVGANSGRKIATMEVFALQDGGSTPADAKLRADLDRGHLVSATIASLLAIVLGLLLARRLTGPLRALAVAARSLGRDHSVEAIPTAGPPEIKDLSQALTGLADSLHRQQSARRQLAQDLAHELRTPLTLVLSRIEAMQDGVVPFAVEGLESLHTEVLRLTRLIGEIEQLAESEARPRRLETHSIALDELAREGHGAHRAAFGVAGIVLLVETRPSPAQGDPDAVRQILTNLLSNALKYTPSGGQVRIQTRMHNGRALLTLTDTGPGIERDEVGKVFTRAYRADSARSRGSGMGLGLAIAQELAAAQQGLLTLASSPEGALFTLSLPGAPQARQQSLAGQSETAERPSGVT